MLTLECPNQPKSHTILIIDFMKCICKGEYMLIRTPIITLLCHKKEEISNDKFLCNISQELLLLERYNNQNELVFLCHYKITYPYFN